MTVRPTMVHIARVRYLDLDWWLILAWCVLVW